MQTEANVVEYFEYFCQISSKSILIISSYTVWKLLHFFYTQYSGAPWCCRQWCRYCILHFVICSIICKV